jgi:hypothetical protein
VQLAAAIGTIADGCHQHGGGHWPNSGDGGEDLALPRMLDDLDDLCFELALMFFQSFQFRHELRLRENSSTHPRWLGDADTLPSQALQLQELRI